MVRTKITAHAGCMGTPKDSLESVKAAVAVKAEICEVDISVLNDGTPVLKHDKVSSSDKNLVRLSDVLDYIKDKNILINLDIKDINALEEIEIQVNQNEINDRVFLTGIGEKEALMLRNSEIDIIYYLNHNLQCPLTTVGYENYLEELAKKIKSLNCIGINSHYQFCNSKVVDKMHEEGLLVSVWTVNDVEDMKNLIEMNVDNITTMNPDIFYLMGSKSKNN